MASDGLEGVIALLRAQPPGEDLAARRASMEAVAAIAVVPDDVDVTPVDAGGVPAERVAAPAVDAGAAILYFHGGAYVSGTLGSHRSHAARLSRMAGVPVVNVDYRLAPEHPFPAAVVDAVASYRWLATGIDPGRIALAGDSAGGGLAAALLVALRDAGDPLPAGAALISPWTDLTMTASTYATRAEADPMIDRDRLAADADLYLGGADPTSPLASPLHADLRGLPPVLVHVGDAECLLDDGVGFAERAAAAGVDVTVEVTPEAIHVWHLLADYAPEGVEAMERLTAWLRTRLGT